MRIALVVALLLVSAPAQALVLPGGLQTQEANSSTSYPWGRGGAATRVQYLYDAIHFTGQNVTAPVAITRLRWRAQGGGSSGGGTYSDVRITLATMPFDHAQAQAGFAANLGGDALLVHRGAVTAMPTFGGAPGAFYVDVPLQVPFVYDPARGDLVIDLGVGADFLGITPAATDARANTTMCARVWALGDAAAAVGTVQANVGAVVEVTAIRDGLVPAFTASVTSGDAPLAVAFTDRSFCSDPDGILAWLWDFDSDGVIDSVDRHPTHVFGCGTFDVTLQIVDATHGLRQLRRQRLVATNAGTVVPAFAWQLVGRDTLRFLDQTQPAPTAWAWDFDGDGVVDSTAAAPTVVFPTGAAPRTVTLSVMRHCRGPFTVQRRVVVAESLVTGTDGTGILPAGATQFADLRVTAVAGIDLLGADVRVTTTAPVLVECLVAADGVSGRDGDAARWRSLGLVNAPSAAPGEPRFVRLPLPVHLEPGDYGLALRVLDGSAISTVAAAPVTQVAAGLTLTHGLVRSGAFAGAVLQPRVWNGALHWAPTLVTGAAGSGFLAEGCAGTAGVTAWTSLQLPQSGGVWRARAAALPQDGAFAVLGLARTNWAGGALPWPLPGAPDCLLRVRPDDVRWLGGVGATAEFALPIPATTTLHGLPLFLQAAVPDPSRNGLGLVFGDVLAARIGS